MTRFTSFTGRHVFFHRSLTGESIGARSPDIYNRAQWSKHGWNSKTSKINNSNEEIYTKNSVENAVELAIYRRGGIEQRSHFGQNL